LWRRIGGTTLDRIEAMILLSDDERGVKTQLVFRFANRRLQEVVDGRGDPSALIPFLCECADGDCRARLEATHSEFDVVHHDERRFFVLPGHVRVDGQQILYANDRFEIVELAGG
jgi:hypothetical protein